MRKLGSPSVTKWIALPGGTRSFTPDSFKTKNSSNRGSANIIFLHLAHISATCGQRSNGRCWTMVMSPLELRWPPQRRRSSSDCRYWRNADAGVKGHLPLSTIPTVTPDEKWSFKRPWLCHQCILRTTTSRLVLPSSEHLRLRRLLGTSCTSCSFSP